MDFALKFCSVSGLADLDLRGGGFVTTNDLSTALALSLFVDRRAEPDERTAGDEVALVDAEVHEDNPIGWSTFDPRGWWGDEFQDVPGDLYGSHLYKYRRAKLTQRTIEGIRSAVEEATSWLVERGIAEAVTVTAEVVEIGRLYVRIIIDRHNHTPVEFSYVWDAIKGLQNG